MMIGTGMGMGTGMGTGTERMTDRSSNGARMVMEADDDDAEVEMGTKMRVMKGMGTGMVKWAAVLRWEQGWGQGQRWRCGLWWGW